MANPKPRSVEAKKKKNVKNVKARSVETKKNKNVSKNVRLTYGSTQKAKIPVVPLHMSNKLKWWRRWCRVAAGKGSALSMFVSGCLDSINFTSHKNGTIRQKVPENWKELA
eukprot:scaffold10121_cov64-Cyclotella_meneghiniana.AAC.12